MIFFFFSFFLNDTEYIRYSALSLAFREEKKQNTGPLANVTLYRTLFSFSSWMNRRAMRIRMEERRREIYMYQQDSFIGQHFHPSKPKRNTAAAAKKKKNCTNNIRKIPKWLCLCVILLYDLHSKSVVNHSRNPSQTV